MSGKKEYLVCPNCDYPIKNPEGDKHVGYTCTRCDYVIYPEEGDPMKWVDEGYIRRRLKRAT
jgi:uncharacterized paraquat-inducible protein A